MIKCGLCGKEFEDGQFDEYRIHVNQCAYEAGLKQKTEEMKKINEELEELKRAKCYYEGLRDTFKEKHPDIYKANFPVQKINESSSKDQNVENIKSVQNNEDLNELLSFFGFI